MGRAIVPAAVGVPAPAPVPASAEEVLAESVAELTALVSTHSDPVVQNLTTAMAYSGLNPTTMTMWAADPVQVAPVTTSRTAAAVLAESLADSLEAHLPAPVQLPTPTLLSPIGNPEGSSPRSLAVVRCEALFLALTSSKLYDLLLPVLDTYRTMSAHTHAMFISAIQTAARRNRGAWPRVEDTFRDTTATQAGLSPATYATSFAYLPRALLIEVLRPANFPALPRIPLRCCVSVCGEWVGRSNAWWCTPHASGDFRPTGLTRAVTVRSLAGPHDSSTPQPLPPSRRQDGAHPSASVRRVGATPPEPTRGPLS